MDLEHAILEEISTPTSNGKLKKRKQEGTSARKKSKPSLSESGSSSETKPVITNVSLSTDCIAAEVCGSDKRISKRIAENVIIAKNKRQKKTVASESDAVVGVDMGMKNLNLRANQRRQNEDISSSQTGKSTSSRKSGRKESLDPNSDNFLHGRSTSGASYEGDSNQPGISSSETLRKEVIVYESMCKKQEPIDITFWKPFEKALFEKGIQIFGHNRLDSIFGILCFDNIVGIFFTPS